MSTSDETPEAVTGGQQGRGPRTGEQFLAGLRGDRTLLRARVHRSRAKGEEYLTGLRSRRAADPG